MNVTFLTLFEFSRDQGRYARMHDIFESFEACAPSFDPSIVPTIRSDGDIVLSQVGLGTDDLWGSRLHNLEALLATRRTTEAILSHEPDVLHVIKGHPVEAVIARAVAERLDIPVVGGPNLGQWYPVRPSKYWESTVPETVSNRLKLATRSLSLQVMDPDALVTFSPYHETMLRTVWGGTVETLLPAVHRKFRPDSGRNREIDLLYVGDLTEQKGYNVFLDVLDRIDGELSLRVAVVGGTPETRPDFETIDVTFHGFVPRDDLPGFYTRAKLFVCLSEDEMGPNTLVEAFSCGTPALVNDVSGLREYIRDGNGVCCDRRDVSDVEATLRRSLDDIEQLIEHARGAAGSYDICRTIEQLGDLYRSVADTTP